MKKLLLVFTVAAFLTACGGGDSTSNETTAPTDSAMISTPAPATTDSAATVAPADSTVKANADSAK
jgi:hypothetical protein